jgi:hypothetical protein
MTRSGSTRIVSRQAARALATLETPDAELQELYRWYRDWSHTARAVIRRRDYLIALGVVDRKKAAT